MTRPPVSIVIPNYDGRDLLAANLPSVRAACEAYRGESEVVVVDDGSTDGSVELLGQAFPWARCVALPENQGFQGAVHAGVEVARHDLVLLLNTDVWVYPEFLGPLAAHFERPDTFAVGALALQPDRSHIDQNIAVPFLRRGTFRFEKLRGGLHAETTQRLPRAYESLYVVGGHCLVDRERFRALGGFDPMYRPFYYEEIDLCYRAWRRGWTVWFEPRSLVVHDHKGTIGRLFGSSHGDRVNERNRLLFTWKNLADPPLFRSHVAHLALKLCYKWAILDGSFYRALGGALLCAPAAWRGRRRERAEATVSDAEIFERIGAAWARLQADLGAARGA
ncbi:MAG: glycosyltransferase family 2 protein [Planctomycetes bacterium]|nr:glycosyltransferase family 2 protein [Planctomycetota bacterium]